MNNLYTKKTLASTPALFVSDATYLKLSPGGVQICTQEYINTLQTAGFSLSLFSYTPERRILSRLKRKLWPQPYADRLPATLADDVAARAEDNNIDFIFLNQVELAPIARQLRERLGTRCKIIVLSHGLESTDIFHAMRTKNEGSAFSQVKSSDLRILAQSLVAECQHRQYIDHIFCLSPFEIEIERWLGAKKVTWLPRTVPNNPLTWSPNFSRLGFVGTVDHPPNREGLLLFLEAFQKIAPDKVRLRLAGGPETAAKALTQRFSCVEYLGRLSDRELEEEARTWSCFVHPLFCYSRGCSTKLAIALGWQIPVITTPAGCRGYTWDQGDLSLAETPESLAHLALQMLDSEVAHSIQREVAAIAHSAPTITEIATKVRSALSLPLEGKETVLVNT